jgi:hypothetical protein
LGTRIQRQGKLNLKAVSLHGFEAGREGCRQCVNSRALNKIMNEQKPKLETKSKPCWFERLPTGEKVLCIRTRKHGQKIEVKLTLSEIENIFKEA